MDKKLFKSILLIITYAVLLVLFIIQFNEVRNLFWTVLGLFQPLFIGFAIAFVLNRPCQLFSRLYDRGLGRTKAKNLSRPLAVPPPTFSCSCSSSPFSPWCSPSWWRASRSS